MAQHRNTVHFTTGGSLKRMKAEFNRLEKPPLGTVARLETELAATFADTQAAVHIITGSLHMSGRASSDFTDDFTWEGDISYGGPSAGVNNPVDYAIFEMARGGAHDFLYPTVFHEANFDTIINDHFDHGAR